MKLSIKTQKSIVRFCFDEYTNSEIANRFNLSKSEVYAFRSKNGLTISNIKTMKANGMTAFDWLKNHNFIEDEVNTCGCCGKPATELYTFPDGKEFYLCSACIKFNDFLIEHGDT